MKSKAERNANKYGYTIIAKPSNPFTKKNIERMINFNNLDGNLNNEVTLPPASLFSRYPMKSMICDPFQVRRLEKLLKRPLRDSEREGHEPVKYKLNGKLQIEWVTKYNLKDFMSR